MSDGANRSNCLKAQALGMFFALNCSQFFLSVHEKWEWESVGK
jgi:hypothetical protein